MSSEDNNENNNNARRGGSRRRNQPPQFRSIVITPEMSGMGVTDIQIQDSSKNMVTWFAPLQDGRPGLMVIGKYDINDLVKTQKLTESQLAEYVGKGLPPNFDPKSFAALLVVALFGYAREQFEQQQEQIQQEQNRINSILDEINELKEENSDLTFEEWQKKLIEKYNSLRDVINKKLPNVWAGLEFGLSTLRVLNIDECDLPLIGILLGRPGVGKTVDITLLSRWIYGYYTDNFSPKAWVSHTTSVTSEEELRAIDMLPNIKDHQFLTPELATLFNLKEDDLRLALSMITRIADGHGYYSNSGVYGRRGYENVMFVWLGAVVDIPHHVYKVMSGLGPRLYFFRLPFKEVTAQDVFLYLTDSENFRTKYKAIEDALFDYLKWFEIGPTVLPRTPRSPHLRKVEWDSSKNDVNAIQCISNLALLLGYLRREGRAYTPDNKTVTIAAEFSDEQDPHYSYFTGEMEDIKRAGTVLTNLARGHALITGRNYITMEDVPIVVKTVLSTARIERVKSFIALIDHGGTIKKTELAKELDVGSATAYRYMTELKAIGLVDVMETNEIEYTKNNNPAMIKVMRLKDDKFKWFTEEEFKRLRENFTPVDNRQFMKDEDPEKEAVKEASGVVDPNAPPIQK